MLSLIWLSNLEYIIAMAVMLTVLPSNLHFILLKFHKPPQIPEHKNPRGNDPEFKIVSNRDGEAEPISLHFSDGIWQQVDSASEDQYVHFSHSRQVKNETSLLKTMRRDRVYYNKQGMLVVKEELKGRFVDGLF